MLLLCITSRVRISTTAVEMGVGNLCMSQFSQWAYQRVQTGCTEDTTYLKNGILFQ